MNVKAAVSCMKGTSSTSISYSSTSISYGSTSSTSISLIGLLHSRFWFCSISCYREKTTKSHSSGFPEQSYNSAFLKHETGIRIAALRSLLPVLALLLIVQTVFELSDLVMSWTLWGYEPVQSDAFVSIVLEETLPPSDAWLTGSFSSRFRSCANGNTFLLDLCVCKF